MIYSTYYTAILFQQAISELYKPLFHNEAAQEAIDITLILTHHKKSLRLVLFWKWGLLELWNGLFSPFLLIMLHAPHLKTIATNKVVQMMAILYNLGLTLFCN